MDAYDAEDRGNMEAQLIPVPGWCMITQTFAEHEARARQMGCCTRPGAGCTCYYYGGIDYAPPWSRANEDIPIRASASGKASLQDQGKSGYGLHVRIQMDDGYILIFAHLSRTTVRGGQYVKSGELIGWMGNTGNSTGKHLHWEIRDPKGIPIDPRKMMGFSEPTPVEPDQPQEPVTLPEFPKLPQARLISDVLNIRSSPEVVNGNLIGRLVAPAIVDVILAVQKLGDIWLRIGHNQWCAMEYQGERYMEWV